jgi:hypothetical protein
MFFYYYYFFFELLKKIAQRQRGSNRSKLGRATQLEMSEPKHGQAAELPRMVDTAAFASPMQVRLLIWLHCWLFDANTTIE